MSVGDPFVPVGNTSGQCHICHNRLGTYAYVCLNCQQRSKAREQVRACEFTVAEMQRFLACLRERRIVAQGQAYIEQSRFLNVE